MYLRKAVRYGRRQHPRDGVVPGNTERTPRHLLTERCQDLPDAEPLGMSLRSKLDVACCTSARRGMAIDRDRKTGIVPGSTERNVAAVTYTTVRAPAFGIVNGGDPRTPRLAQPAFLALDVRGACHLVECHAVSRTHARVPDPHHTAWTLDGFITPRALSWVGVICSWGTGGRRYMGVPSRYAEGGG